MTYQYRPLQRNAPSRTIRVLSLLPGEGDIQASLREVELQDAPTFEALSYCWGTTKSRTNIIIDGKLSSVTPNLHAALERLRDPIGPRTLWIDAICINQADLHEKNVQVRLMRDIYQTSQRVLIWLGPHDRNTGKAFDIIKVMAQWLKRKQSASVDERQSIDQCLLSDPRTAQIGRRKAWVIVCNVFRRPWFTRVWIIQEVSTAYSGLMICGKHEVDWNDVESLLYLNWGLVTGTFQNLINQRREWRKGAVSASRPKFLDLHFESKMKQDLLSLVVRHLEAQATNPRDKIFAFIGLVQDPLYDIEIDYNIEIDTLYTAITREYIRKTHSLDILGFAGGAVADRPAGVPSWILNSRYSAQHCPRPTVTLSWASKVHSQTYQFDASRGSSHEEDDLPGQNALLQVQGLVVDTLAVVGSCLEWSPSTKDTRPSLEMWRGVLEATKCFNSWMDMYQDYAATADDGSIRYATSNPDGPLQIFRQLCRGAWALDRLEDVKVSSSALEDFDAIMKYYRRFCRLGGRDISMLYNIAQVFTVSGQLVSTNFADAVQGWPNATEASLHRRLVRTEQGRLGLVPRGAVVGDSVAVFKGASVPFVIRKLLGARGTDRWMLVGECHIHGVMFGEAWDPLACQRMVIA